MCAPSSSRSQRAMSAPSSRTAPACGCQMPSISRTSVVLPDALGPMTPRLSPGSSAKLDALDQRRRLAAGANTTRSTSSRPRGAGSASCGTVRVRHGLAAEPLPRAARIDQRFPAADQVLDRLQRAAEQDGRRDHDAGRGVGADHEPGADAEHRHLQGLAQRCARARQARRRARRGAPARRAARRAAAASRDRRRRHAHADDHLGVARQRFGVLRARARAGQRTSAHRLARQRSVSTPRPRAGTRRAPASAPSSGCISAITSR